MSTTREFGRFFRHTVYELTHGRPIYWAWVGALLVVVGIGFVAWLRQIDQGLITTNMRDPVSWGFYIGNFTFLVGVAAAAVLLVIPAYVYHWKPLKEVVILGELLAISAIVMCGLFVMVDVGRPAAVWHLLPIVGTPHLPQSLLAWDMLVLNGYLVLNLVIVTYMLFCLFRGRQPKAKIFVPLVLFSIPAAVGIHTVTAFLYNGMAARPFWNASILAPRFIASALCSGPAVLLVLMQLLRRFTKFEIKDEAIWKIAELMAYAMAINLFLLLAEVFKEYYSNTEHLIHMRLMFTGAHGHDSIVAFMWLSVIASIAAFLLFLIPKTRRNVVTLNIGCVLIFVGVFLEKGMGLVIPGMTPDTLGEFFDYVPTANEWAISMGIFGLGALIFTLTVKVATPIMLDQRKPPA